MAQNDNDEFEDDRDIGEETRKPRRKREESSGGTNWGKILLILFGVGAVSLLLCCGGGYFLFRNAFDMTQDPAKIAVMQKEIIEIDLPPDVQPAMGMNMNIGVMKMKVVGYSPNSGTSLMLMQMQISGQTKEQMETAFQQQSGQQNKNFRQESAETKTIKVDGQDTDFIFAKGTLNPPNGTSKPVRMVTGMFPSKDGMGFIQYSIDEDKYDEAAVIKTLESIHK
ncbi:MAG: hypothetical protein U0929_02020 [Planctomycetaceae bacterium]